MKKYVFKDIDVLLSEQQKDILYKLKENYAIKEIALSRGVTVQAIYKNIRKLKKKGLFNFEILNQVQTQEKKCRLCYASGLTHKHHIVPRSMGGTNDEKNLIDLCPTCHAKIHAVYNRCLNLKNSLDVIKIIKFVKKFC